MYNLYSYINIHALSNEGPQGQAIKGTGERDGGANALLDRLLSLGYELMHPEA